MAHKKLVRRVEEALECIEWLSGAPDRMLGTRGLERVWDEFGEVMDEVLGEIEAKQGEDGVFVCYEQDDGPKNELREWLEKVIGEETQREAMEEYKLAVLVHEAAMGDPGEEDE